MTINKHTPGPWCVEGSYDKRKLAVTPIRGEVGFGHVEVYQMRPPYSSDADYPFAGTIAEMLANARLIAAAPELLAALEEVVELADPHGNEPDWLANARAAIAKATGGAQ